METVPIVTRQGCVKLVSVYVEREDRTYAAFLPDSLNTVFLAALLSATAGFDGASCCVHLWLFVSLERSRFRTVCHLSFSSFPSVGLSFPLISCPRPLSGSLSACVCVLFPSVAAFPFFFIGYQAAVCTWALFLPPLPTTTIVSPACLLITPCQPETCDTQCCKHRQAPFANKYLTPDEQGC